METSTEMCRREVVDRTATVLIDGPTWCAFSQEYDSACGSHPMPAECKKACGDNAVTRCSLPLQLGPAMKFPDGGFQCALMMGSYELRCDVTHFEGTRICMQC